MTLPNPESRKEAYLAKASGMTVENLPEPASREEQYLNAIAQGGGGGGTSDFDELQNRPKYNGVTMTGETNIPAVTTYSDFVGTDGSSAGTHGLVPAPATTDAGKFLKADGTWAEAGGGGGGAEAIELTKDDYNYPANNPTCVGLWLLPAGMYYVDNTDFSDPTIVQTTADDQDTWYEYSTYLVCDIPQDTARLVYCLGAQDGYGGRIFMVGASGSLSGEYNLVTPYALDANYGLKEQNYLWEGDYNYPEEDPDGVSVWNFGLEGDLVIGETINVYLNDSYSVECKTGSCVTVKNIGNNAFLRFKLYVANSNDYIEGYGFTNRSNGSKVSLKQFSSTDLT